MRRMSFALTTDQVLARTKTVTRRLTHTWAALKPGDLLLAVDKAMGLKKGEKSRVLAVVRVTDVRVEPLADITAEDVACEGFSGESREEFIRLYAKAYGIADIDPTTDPSCCGVLCRRIAFEYLTGSAEVAALGEANQRKAGARKARERKMCGGTLEYRMMGGMRVYGYVDGRRTYEHRCQRCGMTGTSDGETKTCAIPARRAAS